MDKQLKQDSWVRGAAIGKGSYGTVSLAFTASDHRQSSVFAVKSVDTSLCLPSQIEALESEIRILRSLSSPYVVGYLGDDSTAETSHSASASASDMSSSSSLFRNLHMEYLPGGTVADVARARHPSTFGGDEERIVRNYAFCVASALRYLHSQGIVHCDVKGDNVLVDSTSGTAKLADFGSAKTDSIRPLREDRILPRGSPLWMAPEVIRGEHQGPESDVWSLGCTVIEMVTGKPAWEDRGAAETICRIGYSDELPRIPTQISEQGRDFVEKCLRREINQRWSCDQLLQHPFISKCAPPEFATHASPRSVLGCFNSEYSDEEDEGNTNTSFSQLSRDSEVKDRIGKLSSGGRAIWESDGWTLVRGNLVSVSKQEEAAATLPVFSDDEYCGEDEGEGTSWEYWKTRGAELEDEDNSIVIGELSTSTSEEYLVDSSSIDSAVVETVRNDDPRHLHRDGVVTDTDDGPAGCGWVEVEPSDPRRSRRIHFLPWLLLLKLYYWVSIFHGFYHTNSICCQFIYSTSKAYMKIFGYVCPKEQRCFTF